MTIIILTVGWIVWGLVMRRWGWEAGVNDGSMVTLDRLEAEHIIRIDPNTDEIWPGTAMPETHVKRRTRGK
jgi:hypothetical protein